MHRGRRFAGPAHFRPRRAILRRVILHDERRDLDLRVEGAAARLGRDPALELPLDPDDDVVSAVHARVWRDADGAWWLEDLGSTNGTWLAGRRLDAPARLRTGDRFSLGRRGPALRVAIPGDVPRTRSEPAPAPSQPAVRLRRVAGGEDLLAAGAEIVVGRSAGCAVALRTVADTVVSKRHALIAFDPAGAATITDLDSRNGTFVNGRRIREPALLRLGDRVLLGWHGPLLEVRGLGPALLAEGEGAAYRPDLQPSRTLGGMVEQARDEAGRAPRGAGRARAARFARSLATQLARESSPAFRLTAVAALLALSLALVLVYRSAARERAAADARLAAAERAFAHQLEAASAAQLRSDSVIGGLKASLAAARRASGSPAAVESLEHQLTLAQARAAAAAGPETVADFSRVSRENQDAVGLVITRYQSDSVMGSGFAVTRSGFFVTAAHVVRDPGRGPPRAIEVVMADGRTPLTADLVAAGDAPDQDVAVLKIRHYRGPAVRALDWSGRGVRQGAPAALIGFPRGTELAFDRAGFVRTTMFAGVIAKATPEWIEFAGFTDAGSSGSPVFDAEGAVIAVHYGALALPAGGSGRDGGGGGGGAVSSVPLGFAIPIGKARRWLPPEALAELGLTP